MHHMAEGGGGQREEEEEAEQRKQHPSWPLPTPVHSRLTSHPVSPQLRLGPTRDTHCALGYGVGRGRGRGMGSAMRGGASGEEQAGEEVEEAQGEGGRTTDGGFVFFLTAVPRL